MMDPGNPYEKYVQLAHKPPVHTVRIIDVEQIVVANWVRLKCQYGCPAYGKRLMCPPYSPGPEETRRVLRDYSNALIYAYDFQGQYGEHRELRRRMRKFLASLEREMFLDGYYRAFGMASGPCNLCTPCDVSQPCKHPEIARPALEACGIDVYATAKNSGITIDVVRDYEDRCTFCHLILIE
jgi:predicted metal-binding protein